MRQPTVDEFRRHEAQHGPWMRVRVNGAWAQAWVEVLDPPGRSKSSPPPFLEAVLFCGGEPEIAHTYVHHFRDTSGDCPDWHWCDANGIPVEISARLSRLDSWLASRGLPLTWEGDLDQWGYVVVRRREGLVIGYTHDGESHEDVAGRHGRRWDIIRWDRATPEQRAEAVKCREAGNEG